MMEQELSWQFNTGDGAVPAADSSTSASSYVQFIEPLGVLCCKSCKTAIRPDRRVETHFRQKHKLTGTALRNIIEYSWTVEPLADPHEVELPADGGAPIDGLAIIEGFCCTGCRFLTTSRRIGITHWNDAGHVVTEGGSGGDEDSSRLERVKLQSLSQGRFLRYWIVVPVDEVSSGDHSKQSDIRVPDAETVLDEQLRARLARYASKLAAEKAEQSRTVDGRIGVDHESTWVREMRWIRHLGIDNMVDQYNASLSAISAAARAKLQDEGQRAEQEKMARLGESFDRELDRCSSRIERVPIETLRWLAGVDMNKPAGRPFEMKQELRTMDRYRVYWKRYLCYCVRAYGLGRSRAQEKYRVQFTDTQWDVLRNLVSALEDTDSINSWSVMRRRSSVSYEDGSAAESESWYDINDSTRRSSSPCSTPDMDEERDRALDRQVFEFCITSLKQKVAVNIFRNPLLHFTAVLGINGTNKSWRPATEYTGQLAGLIWCGRVLMLEHIFADEPADRDPDEMGTEAVEHFVDQYRQWMADGTHSPFSSIHRMMAYGKGFRKKEGGMARIMWEDGGEALRYLGSRITVEEFRIAARSCIDEAEGCIDQLMYGNWAETRETFTAGQLVDDLVFTGPGASFATNPKNSWLRPGCEKLAGFSYAKLWDERRGRWRGEQVYEWVAGLQSFREALLPCIHIWGGQPGRGPEIMTVRQCDTQNLLRNVFIFDGQVMIITDRDKNKAIRGIGRKVARFLPDIIGKMMIAYIAWVLPFEAMLTADAGAQGPSPTLEPWLWKDARKGIWGTKELSRQLVSITKQHIGVELSVADYRHVAIELGRHIRGLVVQQLEVDMGDEADYDHMPSFEDAVTGETRGQKKVEYVWDLQATHGSAIARQHYAINIQFPNQLQPQMVANYREISRLWHQYLGYKGSSNDATPTASSALGTPCIVAGSKRSATKTPTRGRASSPSTEGMKRRIAAERFFEVRGSPSDRLQARADTGLRILLGDRARWKSDEQREGMRHIMTLKGNKVLIIVLPTGGGKSIFFMLPAVPQMNAGVSVVVVPFVALMDDLVDRAHEFGIDCLRWLPAETVGREEQLRVARLVVVSADQANNAEFVTYTDSLRSRGLLKRIFIDECHTVIMDASYRTRLIELRGLYRYDCPVILLTATLPVRLERWFRHMMLAEDADIIRAMTVKKNIRYGVVTVKPGKSAVEDEVIRRVMYTSSYMSGDQKGVIYCRSKPKCERLAEKIGCQYYHSSVESEKRHEALTAWAEGRSDTRWIVATTGLGTGVDMKGIIAVVHAEQPYGLVDFVQQTGRGGRREGETVESVIITDGRPAWYDKQGSDVDQANRQGIERFMQTPDCRRLVLGSFMDGVAQDCHSMGVECCDRCHELVDIDFGEGGLEQEQDQEEREEMGLATNRLKSSNKETQQRVQQLRGWLLQVEGKCAVCYIRWCHSGRKEGRRELYQHRFEECRSVQKAEYLAWRRMITFGEYTCCWTCGLPQAWCVVGEVEEGKGQPDCRWKDRILPVVKLAIKSNRLRRKIQEWFEIDVADEKVFTEWLGRTRTIYGERATNAVAVWDMVIQSECINTD
jgi:superfamily II DNA helicase RecQ